MSGKGSARLFTGWLIELYHYTKNANRHMPLSCAHAHEKPIKQLRAKHYAEEWNHYHYFMKSLKALGFTEAADRRVGAAADDARALELHAPGGARGHPRLLDLLGRARGDDDRPRHLQPVLREVGRALRRAARRPSRRSTRTSISTCSTSTRICSSTSSSTVADDVGGARVARSSTTATSSSSTSGCGPTTSRSTTRSSRTRCRGAPFDAFARLRRDDHDHATQTPDADLPLLKRSATVARQNGHVVIRHMRDEVTLEGAAAQLFDKMRAAARRQDRASSAIAEKVVREARAAAGARRAARRRPACSRSCRQGRRRAHDGRGVLRAPPRALRATGSQPVYDHPLWEKIVTGKASRAQVLGFAFEKYHYIEAAFEHMGIAAANATPEMMPHLARHFIEEYTHGDIYRKGLRSLFPDDVDPALAAAASHARAGELPERVGASAARSPTTRATSSCR